MTKPYAQREIDRRIVVHLNFLIGEGRRFRSRYALAAAAKVLNSTLVKVWNGERGVGIETLAALRDNLKLSADWLLDPNTAQELDYARRTIDPIQAATSEEVSRAATPTTIRKKAR